jgi:hypothetical protein
MVNSELTTCFRKDSAMIGPHMHTIAQTRYEEMRRESAQAYRQQEAVAMGWPSQPRRNHLARLGRTLINWGVALEQRYGSTQAPAWSSEGSKLGRAL